LIVVSEKSLGKRRTRIQKILEPLLPKRPEVSMVSNTSGATFQLGRSARSLRDGRIRTRTPSVALNYFEVWIAASLKGDVTLEKWYLHLDAEEISGYSEILALHCDPNIDKNDASYMYKKGPHVHPSGWNSNFTNSHIAVFLDRVEAVCQSDVALDEALSVAIRMIDDEFLPKC